MNLQRHAGTGWKFDDSVGDPSGYTISKQCPQGPPWLPLDRVPYLSETSIGQDGHPFGTALCATASAKSVN
jgi:hypothetical protein